MQRAVLDRRKLWAGVALVCFSIFLPAILTIDTFRVHHLLFDGLATDNQALVIVAACALVGVNTLRGCPHYLGAFLIAESISITHNAKRQIWANALLVFGLIFTVYQSIYLIHGIQYDMGGPAIIVISLQMVLLFLNYSYVSTLKKLVILFFSLAALQFLDVVPLLDSLPFGHGETSQDIKLAAELIHGETLLSSAMLVLFSISIFIALTFFLLVKDENRLLQINHLKEQNQEMENQMRLKEMENRSMQELQHLVHDLKTPLTSIQTFAFVASVQCQGEAHQETREALRYIEESVDHMSNMISEILYQDHRVAIATSELLGSVLAQLSATSYAEAVTSENTIPDAILHINQIRMTRAFINLADNASQAAAPSRPFSLRIVITEQTEPEPMAKIELIDNGTGIPEEKIPELWTRGISNRGSSGLGLAFVSELVYQSGGSVHITSTVGVGTTVTILLPIGEDEIEL